MDVEGCVARTTVRCLKKQRECGFNACVCCTALIGLCTASTTPTGWMLRAPHAQLMQTHDQAVPGSRNGGDLGTDNEQLISCGVEGAGVEEISQMRSWQSHTNRDRRDTWIVRHSANGQVGSTTGGQFLATTTCLAVGCLCGQSVEQAASRGPARASINASR